MIYIRITISGVPGKPGKPTANKITRNSAYISWEPPRTVSGNVVYHVERKEKNTILWIRDNKKSLIRCNYTMKGRKAIKE